MDQTHPLSAPMIGKSCMHDDPYRPCEKEEEVIDKTDYLTAAGALIYLAIHTTWRPNITFATSILATHSQKSTIRHWNGVKHLMRYLIGTKDLGFHFRKTDATEIIGYANSGFKTNETTEKFQTWYIFLKNGAPILWKPIKQTVTTTSTNHAELLALHEASREVVWLRTMEKVLAKQCKIELGTKLTIIYEDNVA